MLLRWRRHVQRRALPAGPATRTRASTTIATDGLPGLCHRSQTSSAKNNVVSMQDLLASNPQRNWELSFNWERALQWWPQAAWKDALGPSFKAEHSRLAALLQQNGPSNHYYLLRRHPELAKDVLQLVVDSTKAFPYVNPLHRDMDIIKVALFVPPSSIVLTRNLQVLRQMALAVGEDNMVHAVQVVIHQRCLTKESARCTPCLYRSLSAASDTTSATTLRDILRHLIHHHLVPEVCYAWFRRHQVPLSAISIGHMMQFLRPGQPHANMETFQQVYADAVDAGGVASLVGRICA
ncbi:hypothetical protein B5M09_008355 [Aphanomyces astaci]|uniref:Uncharacterized protein n=1 Tax=Aphanomyces astaci TaxID=112090 RepID=A0A3R7X4J5_APHAT|nr:hypothetical protein B5M09_008355 [Aphanomyces astaci]